MSAMRSRAWWLPAGVAALLVAFGVGDVLGGVVVDPGITIVLSGRTPAEVQLEDPIGYRLFDFATRGLGLNLLIVGLLLLVIVAIPYRAGQRWAWRTMWILPAWSLAVPLLYLAMGTAADQPPAPPMTFGPILGALVAAALLVDRPRFGGSTGVTPVPSRAEAPAA